MPGYSYKADSADGYRFGFNGQEREVEGLGDYYSFEYRIHNSRLGRFLSVDPLSKEFPWNSSYSYAENRVINGLDLEGAEVVDFMKYANDKLGITSQLETTYWGQVFNRTLNNMTITGQTAKAINTTINLANAVKDETLNTINNPTSFLLKINPITGPAYQSTNFIFGISNRIESSTTDGHELADLLCDGAMLFAGPRVLSGTSEKLITSGKKPSAYSGPSSSLKVMATDDLATKISKRETLAMKRMGSVAKTKYVDEVRPVYDKTYTANNEFYQYRIPGDPSLGNMTLRKVAHMAYTMVYSRSAQVGDRVSLKPNICDLSYSKTHLNNSVSIPLSRYGISPEYFAWHLKS